jgi:hypothetical protein
MAGKSKSSRDDRKSKPAKRPHRLKQTANERLAEQTRKILGKHYASKYRAR